MSKPRDPAWLADVRLPGPNGVTFDHLVAAAVVPEFVSGNIMEDDTETSRFTPGCAAYAGYWNGPYANMTAVRAYAASQHARSFSYTPDGDPGADAIDIEPGDCTPGQFPGFYRAKKGIGVYAYGSASWVSSINAAASSAGIPRSAYWVVSAHYIGPHICGPSSCGYPQADATQFTETYQGSILDATQFSSGFFGTPAPKPPVPGKWTFPSPTRFKAVGGHTTANLTWSAVAPILGKKPTGYEVVVYNDPVVMTGGHWTVVKSGIYPTTFAAIHELEQGKGYQAHVWALGSPVSSQHNYAVVKFRTG